MRTVVSLLIAVTIGFAGAAPAGAADDSYPDPPITIELDPDACAGEDLPFSAASNRSGEWLVTYDGRTATGVGTSVEGTFATEPGDAGVERPLRATLAFDGGEVSASTNVLLPSCDEPDTDGAGDGSGLPGAGGQSLWWVVLALAAMGGGAALMRRRVS